MKTYLMHADRDFVPRALPEPGDTGLLPDLVQDLELDTLFQAMAGGDEFLGEVARGALLSPLRNADEIRYRQDVLADCMAHADVVRQLYDLAVEAIEGEHSIYRSIFSERGEALLNRSIQVIQLFTGVLRRLRALTEANSEQFGSAGFTALFARLRDELDDAYFDEIDEHLKTLRFREGLVMSARLGVGNRGTGYVLRSPKPENRGSWFNRALLKKPTFSFVIADRDEAGFRALGELRDRGLDLVATALGQSAEHVLSFFVALRTELGFYLGALNLGSRLAELGEPTCRPDPEPERANRLSARELYDPCLALRMGRRVVGNDVDGDDVDLIVVTGANQGGKSTFLRSFGLAHVMMQAGLFVAATGFASSLTSGVFTHYKREEDATMSGGKFDEELARMSAIADEIGPGALLLCNESFAATNEREGSDIAAEVVQAMLDSGVRVVFVTHMYDLSHRYETDRTDHTLFLRADRDDDAQRSFRLVVAPPLATAYGEDLYQRTFGTDVHTSPAVPHTTGATR